MIKFVKTIQIYSSFQNLQVVERRRTGVELAFGTFQENLY